LRLTKDKIVLGNHNKFSLTKVKSLTPDTGEKLSRGRGGEKEKRVKGRVCGEEGKTIEASERESNEKMSGEWLVAMALIKAVRERSWS